MGHSPIQLIPGENVRRGITEGTKVGQSDGHVSSFANRITDEFVK